MIFGRVYACFVSTVVQYWSADISLSCIALCLFVCFTAKHVLQRPGVRSVLRLIVKQPCSLFLFWSALARAFNSILPPDLFPLSVCPLMIHVHL